MNRINRLKYTGVIAGVGFAAIIFSSGVYANTGSKETKEEETEVEVISIDLSEGRGEFHFDIEQGADEDAQGEPGLSAGAGLVFAQADEEPEKDVEDTTQAVNSGIEVQEPEPEETEPEKHWGYTNLGIAHVDNHLNIRQEPNENGKLIGKLSKDAACEILEIDENGWAHIKSGKVEGYCSTEYLYLGDEAVARGDRRLGAVLLRAREKGAMFDSWREHFSLERYEDAFRDIGLDPGFYATRRRLPGEKTPYAHINTRIDDAFLLRELEKAKEASLSAPCQKACGACGLQTGCPINRDRKRCS